VKPLTVVITGVTRGCGRAMAERFIALGHTVLGCGRSVSALNLLARQYPRPHDFAAVNVASDGDVAQWAERLFQISPPPDLLINNAGVINDNAPLWTIGAEEFDEVIDTNVKGVANVIRHFVPAMVAREHGVIVNFSSGWGRSTDAEVAPYCATKWAIEGLTQALAQELPAGMAAIPLNPGIINTEMLQSCFGDSATGYPSPEAWAERAVPFLLTLGAPHSGCPLTVP
jgi:NAD(P)-dependent dehydrogenase (short-subunit alcohol dehydrogenase family)